MKAQRMDCNPIITVDSSPSLEGNVNGPSLVLAPPWLENPLGKYYLYFAHHIGASIRLAYSDHLEGPWRIYEPGTLRLEDSFCYDHIASPDVHVDAEQRQVRMYYHGWAANAQRTKAAVSDDGINFTARPENLGHSYFRVFQWGGYHYALGMPGIFYRSKGRHDRVPAGAYGVPKQHAAYRTGPRRRCPECLTTPMPSPVPRASCTAPSN